MKCRCGGNVPSRIVFCLEFVIHVKSQDIDLVQTCTWILQLWVGLHPQTEASNGGGRQVTTRESQKVEEARTRDVVAELVTGWGLAPKKTGPSIHSWDPSGGGPGPGQRLEVGPCPRGRRSRKYPTERGPSLADLCVRELGEVGEPGVNPTTEERGHEIGEQR